jgi:hypothetical protein
MTIENLKLSKKLQIVWSVNAYLILVAGLLCVVSLLLLLFTITADKLRPHGVQGMVATDKKDISDERLSYRLRSSGNGIVALDVTTDQRIETKFGSKDSSNALRNQRFIKISDTTQTQLFPNNNYLITSVYAITAQGVKKTYSWRERDEEESAEFRIYEVVTKDTNEDKRLTVSDHKDLMIAKADGSQLMTIASGVENLAGVPERVNNDQVHLAATFADGTSKFLRLDIASWKMLEAIQLPSLKEK